MWQRPTKRYSSDDIEKAIQEYHSQGKPILSEEDVNKRWQEEHAKELKFYKEYRAFYSTPEWKKLRQSIVKEHQSANTYHCSVCSSTDKLVVDHIKPTKHYWELRLEPSNLQILCEDCNLYKLSRDYTEDLKESMLYSKERKRKEDMVKEATIFMPDHSITRLRSYYDQYQKQCHNNGKIPISMKDFRYNLQDRFNYRFNAKANSKIKEYMRSIA